MRGAVQAPSCRLFIDQGQDNLTYRRGLHWTNANGMAPLLPNSEGTRQTDG